MTQTLDVQVTPGETELTIRLHLTPAPPPPLPQPPQLKRGAAGIDVSKWQGVINWDRVKAAGVVFAGIRATMGTRGVARDGTVLGVDVRFERNWAEAARVKILRAPYHYFVNNGVDPVKQVENFINYVGEDFGELRPVLDVEPASKQIIPNRKENEEAVHTWLIEFEKRTGIRPAIYTASWAWPVATTIPKWSIDYPLWIAQYTNAAAPNLPNSALPWKKYMAWQYTAEGRMDGVVKENDGTPADVDLNRWGEY